MGYTNLGNDDNNIGGKANGFVALNNAGITFPKGFVIKANEVEQILKGKVNYLKEALNGLGKYLAIRSSANIEDGNEKSFAGIFSSCLNVENVLEKAVDSIRKVWKSKDGKVVQQYSAEENIQMAIIIQEMVPNIKYNGVLFGNTMDEHGNSPVLIEFCDDSSKIVEGKKRGNQILLYAEEMCYQGGIVYYRGEEIDISWIRKLTEIIDRLKEKYENQCFDIEWCVDQSNVIHILQFRPTTSCVMVNSGYVSESFIIGANGIGEGNAHVFDDEDIQLNVTISSFKDGDIFVGKYMDTRYYEALEKAGGIIVGNSSVLAHAALVAREKKIPCIIVADKIIEKIKSNNSVYINTYERYIKVGEEVIQFWDEKIDWGRMYDFDSIFTVRFRDEIILIEKTISGGIIHVSDAISNETLYQLQRQCREIFGEDLQIKSTSKYLWFFEFQRYKKIPLFKIIKDELCSAVDNLNEEALKQVYEVVYEIVEKIVNIKQEYIDEEELYIDEMIRAIYFLLDMYIPMGYGHRKIYMNILPELLKENMKYSDFLCCDSINNDLLRRNKCFLEVLQNIRDIVTRKFVEIDAFTYDYYENRKRRLDAFNLEHENRLMEDIMSKNVTLGETIWKQVKHFWVEV